MVVCVLHCFQKNPGMESKRRLTPGRLPSLLNRLGQDVEIVVTPKPSGQAEARVTFRDGRKPAAA